MDCGNFRNFFNSLEKFEGGHPLRHISPCLAVIRTHLIGVKQGAWKRRP